jgi:ABC-type dipeptide/oligopeptide/nickel transport system permease component
MSRYVLWRVLHAIPTLLGVTVIIFVVLRIMPGDPVSVMFGTQATKIRPEDRAKIEADLGLSAPLTVQYLKWLQDIGTGQLGKSFWRGDTVVDLIVQRGPLTVEIAVMAILHTGVAKAPLCNGTDRDDSRRLERCGCSRGTTPVSFVQLWRGLSPAMPSMTTSTSWPFWTIGP